MPTKHHPAFGHIVPEDLLQVDSLLATAADFFETAHEPAQVPANDATFDKLMRLSPDTIGLHKDEEGRIIAWCTVFPTTRTLMHGFLNRELTERRMFDCTQAGDSGALYVMSVFVLPAYRTKINPMSLVSNTIAPFLEQSPEIFYQAWTGAGARLGILMSKRYARAPYRISKIDKDQSTAERCGRSDDVTAGNDKGLRKRVAL